MKKIILFTTSILFPSVFLFSQVGINTQSPNSTLSIEGSFEANYREIKTSTTLTNLDYYVSYTGNTIATFTLPVVESGTKSFSGRIYKIKNLSTNNLTLTAATGNTLRSTSIAIDNFIIPPGCFVEVVNNTNTSGGTWDLSFIGKPVNTNVEIYGTHLYIPPHGSSVASNTDKADFTNHAITKYDTPSTNTDAGWWLVNKTSTSVNTSSKTNSRMLLVYEYQGKPFNIDNMYPIITAGNDQSYPDVFTPSFVKLENVNNKTRLTISVRRSDDYSSSSNWAGTFLMNILLARKTN